MELSVLNGPNTLPRTSSHLPKMSCNGEKKQPVSLSINSISGKGREDLVHSEKVNSDSQEEMKISTGAEEEEQEKEEKEEKNEFEPDPKMNTFVGFLRLGNFVCAATVLFGLAVSIFVPVDDRELPRPIGSHFWQDAAYYSTGWIQVMLKRK